LGHKTSYLKIRGIPHLAKNERDAPDFPNAALDTTKRAPFFKERRMKFVRIHEISQEMGDVGHPRSVGRRLLGWPGTGEELKQALRWVLADGHREEQRRGHNSLQREPSRMAAA
jgi:hypothetical protein